MLKTELIQTRLAKRGLFSKHTQTLSVKAGRISSRFLNLDNSNFDTPSTTISNRQYGTSKHRREEAEEEVVRDERSCSRPPPPAASSLRPQSIKILKTDNWTGPRERLRIRLNTPSFSTRPPPTSSTKMFNHTVSSQSPPSSTD